MSMFSGAKNARIYGGTYHAAGRNTNMFENASNVKARGGATFITGSDSPVEGGNSSRQSECLLYFFYGC